MDNFTQHQGLVLPLDIANVDTDQIIPKQFLQKTERVGFGQYLFNDWRYLNGDITQVNSQFILNQPIYQGASILLTRENFGCGSSREHAPWALQEYGFKVIIGTSFADIFYQNCINIGVLPITLTEAEINQLFTQALHQPLTLAVDLPKQLINCSDTSYTFELAEFHKYCLEHGIDSIDWTLTKLDKIIAFEQQLPAWQ